MLTSTLAAGALVIALVVAFGGGPGVGGDVQQLGVTNLDSLHLSDTGGTATPVLLVNQDGAGVIAEFQDGGTPVAQWVNGGGLLVGSAGMDLNGTTLTVDTDADTTLVASVDDIITITLGAATGRVDLLTGNLKVGNGTEDTTLNGEDAYIEGTLEVDGATNFDGAADFASTVAVASSVNASADVDVGTFLNLSAQTAISITQGSTITPTGTFQPIQSWFNFRGCNTTKCIEDGGETGDLLILMNVNATNVITIDGAGGNVECKADVVLGPEDTLSLVWHSDDWNCVSTYDNS